MKLVRRAYPQHPLATPSQVRSLRRKYIKVLRAHWPKLRLAKDQYKQREAEEAA